MKVKSWSNVLLFSAALAGGGLLALPVTAFAMCGHGGEHGGRGSGCAATTTDVLTADDMERGRQRAAQECARCHGADGNASEATIPSLAGQKSAYLLTQLQNFRAGQRHNRLMTPVAQALAEQDAAPLAAHFSAQTLKLRPGSGASASGLVEAGRALYEDGDASRHLPACSHCHDAGPGHGPRERFPLLGGQPAAYVVSQLKQFQARERQAMPPMMTRIAARLDENDMQAVAAFIAARPQR